MYPHVQMISHSVQVPLPTEIHHPLNGKLAVPHATTPVNCASLTVERVSMSEGAFVWSLHYPDE